MRKEGNTGMVENVKSMKIEDLWDLIDNYNAKAVREGGLEMPFYIHRNRLKGYSEAEGLFQLLGVEVDLSSNIGPANTKPK